MNPKDQRRRQAIDRLTQTLQRYAQSLSVCEQNPKKDTPGALRRIEDLKHSIQKTERHIQNTRENIGHGKTALRRLRGN